MKLEVENLSYSYGGKPAIDGVSIKVDYGEFVGIIGPNGSGKSTLLKNIYRGLTPGKGKILLDGYDLISMNHRESALRMAVVSQENDVPFDFSVEEIVAMGRSPHKKLFDIDTADDRKIVMHALEHLGIENMAKRNYLTLSGGEKQRVIIARAMAQECDFLVLDEPTNHLDINYQMQIFDSIGHVSDTVLAAIHDLNMAALYCDRLYALKDGKVRYEGTPEEVLTEENIYDLYGVSSKVAMQQETGRINIVFIPDKIHGGYGHTQKHRHDRPAPVEHSEGYFLGKSRNHSNTGSNDCSPANK